jgi:DNA (cytosine-5)-methyltransferase 1
VENSPALITRGIGVVLGDLAALGYDCRWTVLGAADVGANHQRDRIWIIGKLANTSQLFSNGGNNNARISMEREAQFKSGNDSWKKNVPNSDLSQRKRRGLSVRVDQEHAYACNARWWQIEPDVGRVANGVAARMDRLKAVGNGQVPLCAAEAWRILTNAS